MNLYQNLYHLYQTVRTYPYKGTYTERRYG